MPKGPFRVRNLATLDDHLSDTEASDISHYRITLDDEGMYLVEERYEKGLVLKDRVEFTHALDGQTAITTRKCFDSDGKYTGKVVGKFTPPDIHEAEVYDAEDNLTHKTDGLFKYTVMDGKPVLQ